MKKSAVYVMLFLLLFAHTAFTQEKAPFIATITRDRVNIRAGTNLNYEVMYQLNKNDLVRVVDEMDNWYKVRLPEQVLCYIKSDYVEKNEGVGRVKGDSVNIRCGPGQNYTILAQLNKDDKVKIIKDLNGWYGIAAPSKVYGYIHKEFVKYYMQEDDYIKQEKKKEELLQRFSRVQKIYDEELKKDIDNIDLKPIQAECMAILEECPQADFASGVKDKIKEINLKMAEIDHKQAARLLESEKKIYEQRIRDIDSISIEKLPPPTASGIIQDVGKIIDRVGTHKLVQDGKIKYYLYTKKGDLLNKYVHQYVYVWGQISDPRNSKYPIIDVDLIKPVNAR